MSGQVDSKVGPGLRELLKRTSRSFYLSIQVLPGPVRTQVAIGYLIARAADSIADTTAVASERRQERLLALREAALADNGGGGDLRGWVEVAGEENGTARAERELLGRLPECLGVLRGLEEGDRRLVRRVLSQLIEGMLRDLRRFPATETGVVAPEEVVALSGLSDLDEYTYFAAGCVGEFWTDLTAAHMPEVGHLLQENLRERGVDLGRALQLVNVIRDVGADLRAGRCYWPAALLSEEGLTAQDLAKIAWGGAVGDRAAILRVTGRLLHLARERVERAWPYVEAIPPRALRLRLACVWPLWICLDTLTAIARAESPLLASSAGRPPAPVKVRRKAVYSLVASSTWAGVLDMAGTGSRMSALYTRHLARAPG